MGMGEPLHNFTEVIKALWRMTTLLGMSKRRITPGVNLAISLNATTDRIRNEIMPVNRKYSLKELMNACKRFPLEPRRKITFEYVLIDTVNDSQEDAFRLVQLLKGIKSKVNLIPINAISFQGKRLKAPSEGTILTFQRIVCNAGMAALIRKSKGSDISAACGQLKATYR
jgi:23S rRNA (adenine2503-C2)-methyltransferase